MFRAFRHRNYQLFFGGQLISLSGTWMQFVAQSWLVYRLTGSAILLGVVGFSLQIPVFLLSPFGGTVADRHDRRLILVATQTTAMLLALTLAALTLTNVVRVWHLPLLAALLGVVNAFDVPARQAFVMDMVGKDDLINAVALNSSMFNSARIIGPAIAGVLVATIGEGWCFFANGVSYLAVIAGLLLMRLPARKRERTFETALSGIAEGFTYAWRTETVRALLLLLGLVSIMGMPFAVLMPIFAGEVLHGGPRALGLLMGASGCGALAGALILAARRGVHGLEWWVALSSACFGAFLVLFSLSRSFWLSAALLFPAGFFMIGQMASSNTLIQTITPDGLRGRVMSVYSMMFLGMAPFGALLAGAISHRLGAPNTVTIGGLVCIVGATVFGLRLRAMRHDALRMIVAAEPAGGDPADEETGRGSVLAPRD
jgi:MFS family permease